MTFSVNVNHISKGLLSGAYPGLTIDTNAPAIPFVYNVFDPATVTVFNNFISLPKQKVFIGSIKFSITPVDDSRVIILDGLIGDATFSYTDSIGINGRNEKYLTMPIITTKITSTLTAKYSVCFYGYMFEYSF